MGIIIPLILIFWACLLIWRACDGFEVASEYIGRNLSEGVRGGTINAVSSSIPELFTTLIALFVLSDRDGFSVGIGTTAGSALFNGMIIPAVCILAVVGTIVAGVRVTSVNVSTKVILRDGLSLIFCEFLLILLINGRTLHWWQGLILMALYATYLAYMILSMKTQPKGEDENGHRSSGGESSKDSGSNGDSDQTSDSDQTRDSAQTRDSDQNAEPDEASGMAGKMFYWLSGGPAMDLEGMFVKDKQRQQMKDESWNGWPLLLTSTAVIGVACWALVIACEWLGTGNNQHPSYTLFGQEFAGLGIPAMFVAVIFAAMATSVPDTVMSIRDAKDGDYDDAVANALGSNIFDICFALGFPLFLYTLVHGPIEMPDAVAEQSGELRILLLGLTIAGFFVYYLGKRGVDANGIQYIEMRRGKAFLLLALYGSFLLYIIGRSQNNAVAHSISISLQSLLSLLPAIS